MVWRIGQFYARRIVNVNVNVVVAGFLAGLVGVLFVNLTRFFTFFTAHRGWIVVTGVVADVIADVTIYYVLHWIANHWSVLKWARVHVPPVVGEQSFFKSATLVQFERAMLSPIYYGALVAANYLMLHPPFNFPREAAFALGVLSGLSSTRVLHTLWMMRADRKCRRANQCPIDAPGAPGPAPSTERTGEENGVLSGASAFVAGGPPRPPAGPAHRVSR